MKIKFLLLIIITFIGCKQKEKTSTPSVGYAIYSSNNNGLCILVFDNNDTIYAGGYGLYMDGKNNPIFNDYTKIISDNATIARIKKSINTELTEKSLLLERETITCGAGGSLCLKTFYKNGKKELKFHDLSGRFVSTNLYTLFSYLEKKYPEIENYPKLN